MQYKNVFLALAGTARMRKKQVEINEDNMYIAVLPLTQ